MYAKIYQDNASNCRVSCYCRAWHDGKLVRLCLARWLATHTVPGCLVWFVALRPSKQLCMVSEFSNNVLSAANVVLEYKTLL